MCYCCSYPIHRIFIQHTNTLNYLNLRGYVSCIFRESLMITLRWPVNEWISPIWLVQSDPCVAITVHEKQREKVNVYHKMISGLHGLWQQFQFLQFVLCTSHTPERWGLAASLNNTWYQHLQQLQHQWRRLSIALNTFHSLTWNEFIMYCKISTNVKVNCHALLESVGGVLISLFQVTEPIGGYTTVSVTHGQCDARPTVTFPAKEHHRPLAGTKLYQIQATTLSKLFTHIDCSWHKGSISNLFLVLGFYTIRQISTSPTSLWRQFFLFLCDLWFTIHIFK